MKKEEIALEIAETNKRLQEILKIRKDIRKEKSLLDKNLANLNEIYKKI